MLPFLKKFRRFIIALYNSIMPVKISYSQSAEDKMVWELTKIKLKPEYIYIDVGANQPTQISNTYLFYRKGFRGIVIEPNHELSVLFRRFRPGDIHLTAGCSDKCSLGKFKLSDSTSVSGFGDSVKLRIKGYSWVPMLTVDEIWLSAGEEKTVFLLSIDTEGFDLQVLKGAMKTLQNTICLVIETSADNAEEINTILKGYQFELITKTENNYIYLNQNLVNK